MTDSNTPHISIPKPVVPAQTGPKDYEIPAGKTVVLVDSKNNVTLVKSVVSDIRIFTQWNVNLYPDLTTAETAITTNKWNYTPQKPIN